MSNAKDVTSETTTIWKNHVTVPNTPAGFTVNVEKCKLVYAHDKEFGFIVDKLNI